MEFEKKEEAQLAIDEMDGSQLLEQDISVTWAFVRGKFYDSSSVVRKTQLLALGYLLYQLVGFAVASTAAIPYLAKTAVAVIILRKEHERTHPSTIYIGLYEYDST